MLGPPCKVDSSKEESLTSSPWLWAEEGPASNQQEAVRWRLETWGPGWVSGGPCPLWKESSDPAGAKEEG